MHVEKNVCDSILGILLDIKGKTKEGHKSRKDFVDLNIRHELHQEERANGKYYLPAASYNMTTDEKKAICKCPRGMRVPTGYSSNIKNLVSMKDLKLVSMNSHDCHVSYTEKHLNELRLGNEDARSEDTILEQHKFEFSTWFKRQSITDDG